MIIEQGVFMTNKNKNQVKNEITLDSMDQVRKSFWTDVNDVKKKTLKKELKAQNIQEVCYHDMKSTTKH